MPCRSRSISATNPDTFRKPEEAQKADYLIFDSDPDPAGGDDILSAFSQSSNTRIGLPGANFDEQYGHIEDLFNRMRGGVGDVLDWLEDNFDDPLNTGEDWAETLVDDLLEGNDGVMVGDTIAFDVADAAAAGILDDSAGADLADCLAEEADSAGLADLLEAALAMAF